MNQYGVYGKFRSLQNAAWRCLADCNINTIPVKATTVAKRYGVMVQRNSELNMLSISENGCCILKNNQWHIIIRDELPTEMCHMIIAHELGHILLGHGNQNEGRGIMRIGMTIQKEEQEAEAFSIRLLCPASVLAALDIHTAEEIQKWCQIPIDYARKRAQRMKLLYERDKFFTSSLEKEVFLNFLDYIRENGNPKRTEEFYRRCLESKKKKPSGNES